MSKMHQKVEIEIVTLPSYAAERVAWATKAMYEEGLHPLGALEIILAYDEEKSKKEFEFGSSEEWLKVTDKFIEWRDDMSRTKQLTIMSAIVNGYCTY